MGAGESTAASCSSLDNNSRSQCAKRVVSVANSRYRLPARGAHNQALGEPSRAQRYSKKPGKSANMKHYSSHFDLTNDQILLNHADQATSNSQLRLTPDRACLDSGQHEVYSLSNADIGLARPIMVPVDRQASHPFHIEHHLKHQLQYIQGEPKNIPVVNRIHQRHHQLRLNEMKKLSDSLPSLNNMADLKQVHRHPPSSPYCHNRKSNKSLAQQQVCHSKYQEQLGRHHEQQVAAIKRATSLSTLHNNHELESKSRLSQQCNQYQPYQNKQPAQHNLKTGHPARNQQTSVVKKISKFRQVSAQAGSQLASVAKKYKRRQAKQSSLQQQQQQQACQVLPPLPRSQSLHELIQLRATENGQRMRTTGTLRTSAPQANQESKVNLVAEILESRRQRQHTDAGQLGPPVGSNGSSSRSSSSTDDGIHDVDLGLCGDQSTGGSHAQALGRNERSSPPSGIKRGSANMDNHRPSSQMLNSNLQVDRLAAIANSTLKRSMSHSALHENLSNLALNQADDYDEDGSEDLSELAKFLYQFKQRQKSNQGASANGSCPTREPNAREPCPHEQKAQDENGKQQQSPNSTTSSSGFASSSCATNSISSTGSHKKPANTGRPSGSRKKYPAPSRPSQLVPLKSAPSLLSIVDESRCDKPNSLGTHGQVVMSEQLEQLERYTKMRQMSQSELALNHLISNSACRQQLALIARDSSSNRWSAKQDKREPRAAGKRDLPSNRAYKSRLINLIRRISDKQAEVSSSGSYQSSVGGREADPSSSGDPLDRSSWRPINQSESIVPQPPHSNCQPSRQAESATSDLDWPRPIDKRLGRGASADQAGESVCDLNFDCDFELVKNCGTSIAGHHQRADTKPSSLDKSGVGSLLLLSNQPATGKPAGCLSPTCCSQEGGKLSAATAAPPAPPLFDGCSDNRRHQPIGLQSTGENNWKLVAPSSQQEQQPPVRLAQQALDGHRKRQAACQSVAGQLNPPQTGANGKLKWSASHWLASRRDSSSSSSSAANLNKGKNKQPTAAPACNPLAKSYLSKLIAGSRTSAAGKQASPGAGRTVEQQQQLSETARVNSEAHQLLDELDHSLDLVSAGSPLSRAPALSWWRSSHEPANASLLGSLNASDNSDAECTHDDDELGDPLGSWRACERGFRSTDDEDSQEADEYASFSRALLYATFDAADTIAEHERKQQQLLANKSSSPSDSFTFSRPASPVTIESNRAHESARKPSSLSPVNSARNLHNTSATHREGQTKASESVNGPIVDNNNCYPSRGSALAVKLAVKELCAKHEQEIMSNKQDSHTAHCTSTKALNQAISSEPAGCKQAEPDTRRLISNALEQVASLVCKTTNCDDCLCCNQSPARELPVDSNDRAIRSAVAKKCRSASNLERTSCCAKCHSPSSQLCSGKVEQQALTSRVKDNCGRFESASSNKLGACSPRSIHAPTGRHHPPVRQERIGFGGELATGSCQRAKDNDYSRDCLDNSCSAKRLIERQPHLNAPKCKLVPMQKPLPACQLHSSSKQSRTHHNEDVKLGVSRDNPIQKGGHHDADSCDKVAVVPQTGRLAGATNCRRVQPTSCCSSASSSVAQPQNLHRPSRLFCHGQPTLSTAVTGHLASGLNRSVLSGAPKLISIKNKLVDKTSAICRSNSELTSSKFSLAANYAEDKDKFNNEPTTNPIKGRVRAGAARYAALQSNQLRQISKDIERAKLLTSYASTSNLSNADFDDNFILRRTTPNAGLRTRC